MKKLNVYETPVLEIVIFSENDFMLLSGNDECIEKDNNGGIGLPDFGL